MRRLVPGVPISVGMAVVLLFGVTGCVTTTDLEKLDAGLTQKLEALNNTVQTQVAELRAQLRASQTAQAKRVEGLANYLTAVRADTTAAVEKVTAGELERSRILNELKTETTEARKAMTESAAETKRDVGRIAALTAELKTELHNIGRWARQTLLGNYKVEEAALRERLRALAQVREELESGPSIQDSEVNMASEGELLSER